MKKDEPADMERQDYMILKDYLDSSQSDLKMMLRIIDKLCIDAASVQDNAPNSAELGASMRDMAVRLRMLVSLLLHDHQDLKSYSEGKASLYEMNQMTREP